jgi:hypothetical protein
MDLGQKNTKKYIKPHLKFFLHHINLKNQPSKEEG